MAELRLSTIPFYTDIAKREILSKYIDVKDEFTGILDILEATGRYIGTDNKEYFNYTNDWVFKSITVGASGGKAITADQETTLALASGEGAKVIGGDWLSNAAGQLLYVQSVSGDTLSVHNPEGSTITIANDEELSVPTSGIAEGEDGEEMPVGTQTQRSNQVQYFETFTSATDVSVASKIEVDIFGQDNYFSKHQHEGFMKHRGKIGFAFIVGKKLEAKDSNGNEVPMTRGLNSYATDFGKTHVATNASSTVGTRMDKADWRTFSRSLDVARAPQEGMLWCGGEASASLDDLFDIMHAQGGVRYDTFGKANAKAKAIDMGVKSFTLYDRTYHKSKLPAFDHEEVTGITDSKYPDTAYFIGSGKVSTVDGASVNRIQGRYFKMPNGLSGRYEEIETGGLSKTKGGANGRKSVLEYTHKSWEGLEMNGVEHLGKFVLKAA